MEDTKLSRAFDNLDIKSSTRLRETQIIADTLQEHVGSDKFGSLRVLEFGAGPCEAASYYKEFGELIVTDVYQDANLNLPEGVSFVLSDITKSEFDDGQFDLLISNQVIEHIDNLPAAFKELRRIAADDAVIAFGIPTASWLIMAIPGLFMNKVDNLLNRILRRKESQESSDDEESIDGRPRQGTENMVASNSLLSRLSIGGHGSYPGFFDCFFSFRVANWRKVLRQNDFEIIHEQPMLAYGSFRLQLFPPNKFLANLGMPASLLFVCKKSNKVANS